MEKLPRQIFKAYDIRGRYPEEINEGVASSIAKQVIDLFKRKKVILGHDARLSSPALYKGVIQGVKAAALEPEITEVGIATTPMLYFLVNYLKADIGIMVTASHNPKEYNGLKVVGPEGEVITGEQILKKIESATMNS